MFTSNIADLCGIKIVAKGSCYKVVNGGVVRIKSNVRRKYGALEFTFDRLLLLNDDATYKFSVDTNGGTCRAQITHVHTGISHTYPLQSQYIIFKPKYTGTYEITVFSEEEELAISSVTLFHICAKVEEVYQCDIDNISELLNPKDQDIIMETISIDKIEPNAIDDVYIDSLKLSLCKRK